MIRVLQALAADPARWRYGYDLATEVHLKSGSLYPILIRLADRCTARNVMGASSTRPAASSPVSTHSDRAGVRGGARGGSDRSIGAEPPLGLERNVSGPVLALGLIGAGRPSVLTILLLAGAGAVLWSREHPPPDAQTLRDDLPLQLLRSTGGLLPAERAEWGQAMLGELDRIEGRSRRWRFALGCSAGIVLLPPWGPVAPMAVLGSVALGSAVVFSFGFIHFGLAANPWNWVLVVILAALVMGSIVGVSVLLRRPGVGGLGLVGGLFVAAAWLVFSGFTWAGIISPINSVGAWSGPALLIGVPLVVGVGGAWRSKSAVVGRRAARLAGVSAGLAMFFVSTIAVVAIDGGPRDPGAGVAGGVSEAFSNVAMLFLLFLPLATAAIGWVAATAIARFRSVDLAEQNPDSMSTPKAGCELLVPGRIDPLVARCSVLCW